MFLRYFRLLQILVVTIVSFSLSASFINVGSSQKLEEKEISRTLLLGTGYFAAFFGVFVIFKAVVDYIPSKNFSRFFLNLIGNFDCNFYNLDFCQKST